MMLRQKDVRTLNSTCRLTYRLLSNAGRLERVVWQGSKAKRRSPVMKRIVTQSAIALGIVLALSACTDPYDPGQRALGGGLIGAGAGAAIGGLAGGGQGAVSRSVDRRSGRRGRRRGHHAATTAARLLPTAQLLPTARLLPGTGLLLALWLLLSGTRTSV